MAGRMLGLLLMLMIGVAKSSVDNLTISLGDTVPVETPAFPKPAPPNWQNTWHITSPPGTKITFSCYDIRLIKDNPSRCEEDVLIVNGGGERVELCGNQYDFLLETEGNELTVEIRKGEIEGGGVSCTASVPLPTTTAAPPILKEESVEVEPGGEPYTILTPNYPQLPPPKLTYTWKISTLPASRIRITCPDLRTVQESEGKCADVTVRVIGGEKEEVLCGQQSGFTMLSTGSELQVVFNSGLYGGGSMKCEVRGRVMDWYGEATPPPPSTVPPYLGIQSEEVDSSEHGGPPGPKTTSCPCGWANKDSKRIVNGRETKINEFPWMVAIADRIRKYQFCGGSIITPYHVLTAAHCTSSFVQSNKPISVVVGDHNLYVDEESNVTEMIDVEKIIQHPDYHKYWVGEDIALLLLAKRIEFNNLVGPVCLSPTRLPLARQYVKIIGWGKLAWNESSSDLLQKVDVRVIHLETCNRAYSYVSLEKRVQICTYANKRDACQGDSGGPVVWVDPETNRYVLVGLVSFGTVCANEDPTVHTDVSAYYDWIQDNIKATMPQETCMKV